VEGSDICNSLVDKLNFGCLTLWIEFVSKINIEYDGRSVADEDKKFERNIERHF